MFKVEPAQFTAIEVYDLLIKAGSAWVGETNKARQPVNMSKVLCTYQISTHLFMFFCSGMSGGLKFK